jgi:hypothetical protein
LSDDAASDEPSRPVRALALDTETILLGGGALVLILAVPAGLFLYRGRTQLAIRLVVIFAAMVVVTGYALHTAAKVEREE